MRKPGVGHGEAETEHVAGKQSAARDGQASAVRLGEAPHDRSPEEPGARAQHDAAARLAAGEKIGRGRARGQEPSGPPAGERAERHQLEIVDGRVHLVGRDRRRDHDQGKSDRVLDLDLRRLVPNQRDAGQRQGGPEHQAVGEPDLGARPAPFVGGPGAETQTGRLAQHQSTILQLGVGRTAGAPGGEPGQCSPGRGVREPRGLLDGGAKPETRQPPRRAKADDGPGTAQQKLRRQIVQPLSPHQPEVAHQRRARDRRRRHHERRPRPRLRRLRGGRGRFRGRGRGDGHDRWRGALCRGARDRCGGLLGCGRRRGLGLRHRFRDPGRLPLRLLNLPRSARHRLRGICGECGECVTSRRASDRGLRAQRIRPHHRRRIVRPRGVERAGGPGYPTAAEPLSGARACRFVRGREQIEQRVPNDSGIARRRWRAAGDHRGDQDRASPFAAQGQLCGRVVERPAHAQGRPSLHHRLQELRIGNGAASRPLGRQLVERRRRAEPGLEALERDPVGMVVGREARVGSSCDHVDPREPAALVPVGRGRDERHRHERRQADVRARFGRSRSGRARACPGCLAANARDAPRGEQISRIAPHLDADQAPDGSWWGRLGQRPGRGQQQPGQNDGA